MLKKIKFQIENIRSQNDKALIETEIDVLRGVTNINVNQHTGEAWVEFEEIEISQKDITEAIKKLGYIIREQTLEISPAIIREYLYFVQGMHCASCEILIEKRLLDIKGIKSVEAKANRGEILIEYIGKRPKSEMLNSIFRKENYIFSDQPIKKKNNFKKNNFFKLFIISLLLIGGFLYLNKSGLSGLVNVSSKSSLPAFFVLGLIAGVSSCAALVGGIVLSMSKQWLEIYSNRQSTFEKLQPHLMFNVGRVASYAILGAILGAIGSKLQISLQFTSFVIIVISILMFFLALQMLGVKNLQKFQFTLPKFATRYIANETNFKGRYMPFLMGGLTFFLPCGFTITSQGLALLSGNLIQGGLIMAFFALGTTPGLLLIGFSAIKFSSRPHLTNQFSKVAGVLILFFALFNINNQLNVLGYSSFSNLSINSNQSPGAKNNSLQKNEEELPPVVDGKQILKMEASSFGYSPNYFKVRAGVPVRWEITDKGTSGCTNAIISKNLFDEEIPLTPGQTSIKEFTPEKPGRYKFSCWMGMVSGIIEVVGDNGSGLSPSTTAADNETIIPSGAKGCGCGGGGSGGSCGAR